ncbi:hypothetical protein SanaruYs_06620 [Chryseotalea sanaruensis]|uniref:Uncharacterized protein n=1 Tax=Chryseotalea sanaruensis TaxID=2482724 RepID=A0A401U6E0_9BACT|nr:hypothetical protein [Chryseotalea sanaruensis]GCC50447.1 hypothetical protein SanaruYs_06620 [Chryseotalea sanaruensis]
MKTKMKYQFVITYFILSALTHYSQAQQWTGSPDVNGQIERTGNIRTNGLSFGSYGTSLVGDSAPYMISSPPNGENHDLMLFGNSTATLNLRLFDGDFKLGPYTTPNAILYNSGNAFFNGNVGIGVSQPGAKLEVNGNINVGSPNSVVLGYGATLNFLGASLNGDPLWISRYNNSANKSELRLNLGDDFGQQEDMFTIGTHHWNGGEWKPHFSVHASGKVGIGTTNPTQKLTVNGTVYSTEVKVDVNAGTGPDYVFEPTYQLPSLIEIENYIKANKHLPEVPSAKEMETNGINLSEMNMLLLKKVEELTLHLIEQQKEIEMLKTKIK